jgi:hypothetical protein
MAGFVGYCVHATGFHWPWPMSGGGLGGQFPGQLYEEGSHLVPNPSWFPAYNGGGWPTLQNGDVPALWDQMSDPAKWQILLAVLFLELWGESMVRARVPCLLLAAPHSATRHPTHSPRRASTAAHIAQS